MTRTKAMRAAFLVATLGILYGCPVSRAWAAGTPARTAVAERPAVSSPAPLLVNGVQDPGDAAHIKEREDKADSHDAADLDAQIRAATAAEQQVAPSWVASIFSGLGTIGIAWSLYYSAGALKQTIRSNDLQRETMVQDLRAYIGIKAHCIHNFDNSQRLIALWVTGQFDNYGRTPCTESRIRVLPQWITPDQVDQFAFEWEVEPNGSAAVIFPGIPSTGSLVRIDPDELLSIYNNERILLLHAQCVYVDAFKIERMTQVCFRMRLQIDPRELVPENTKGFTAWQPISKFNIFI